MRVNLDCVHVVVIASIGLALRGIVSLSSYSGKSKPPMYGDYEAQRHWQEITFNLPVKEWYTNTTNNDLMYWGLDYPPLTAFHSYMLGYIAHSINTSYVELFKSRGFESEDHKTFMRLTVLAADLFVYLPACILLASTMKERTKQFNSSILILLVLYPGLILIDNGHFQYNNISLGLLLMAVAAAHRDFHKSAAILFSLSINYKQMELYHALTFFVYLLRVSLLENGVSRRCGKLMEIAFVTLATFGALWLPWMSSLESFFNTLSRLFPFSRGVFEDKVANVWCSLNVLYKFKENVTNFNMAKLCLATTLLAVLPINLHTFTRQHPKIDLLICLFNSSLAFFLFSFQVHEKSILLSAIPMACLLPCMPFYAIYFMKLSILSMLPLFIKDHLVVQYFCMYIMFTLSVKHILRLRYTEFTGKLQLFSLKLMDILDWCIMIISLAAVYIPSPSHLPHIWSLFIAVFCCGGFLALLVLTVLYQFNKENYAQLKAKNAIKGEL